MSNEIFTPQEISNLKHLAKDEENRSSCLGILWAVVLAFGAVFGLATIILVFTHYELFK